MRQDGGYRKISRSSRAKLRLHDEAHARVGANAGARWKISFLLSILSILSLGGSEDTPTAFSAVPSRFLRYTAAPLYRNLFPAKSYIKRARYRRERKREKGERDGGREPQGERISVEHRAESSSKLARLSYIYLLILSSLIPLSLSRNLSLVAFFLSLPGISASAAL